MRKKERERERERETERERERERERGRKEETMQTNTRNCETSCRRYYDTFSTVIDPSAFRSSRRINRPRFNRTIVMQRGVKSRANLQDTLS